MRPRLHRGNSLHRPSSVPRGTRALVSSNTDRKVRVISSITDNLSLLLLHFRLSAAVLLNTVNSIKCLLPSWLPFSQCINHAQKPLFFIMLIVMTTRLCSAACHFTASKAEKTALLYFNFVSRRVLHTRALLWALS